jgi:hypothetical protein
MQPTQQTVIPWSFFIGTVGTSFTTVVIPAGFDGVITDIGVGAGVANANPQVGLFTAALDLVASMYSEGASSSTGGVAEQQRFVVIPDGTGLKINANVAGTYVSVSGFLLTPAAAGLIPV